MLGISFSRKGFTLLELMIVVSIVGILFVALYPSLRGYIERAKISNTQTLVRSLANTLQQFHIEVGEIKNEPYDNYCFSLIDDPMICGSPIRHVGMNDFLKLNAPKLLAAPGISDIAYYNIAANTWLGWGYNFPNKDMTKIEREPMLAWYFPGGNYGTAPETSIFVNGNNMPVSANKLCSPGIAISIGNYAPSGEYTECGYFFR